MILASKGRVLVRLDPVNSCSRCLSGKGCGAGVFSRLFARRSVELDLPETTGIEPGMPVDVGISSRALMRACLRLYGLPLAGFLGGVMAVHLLGGGALANHGLWVSDAAALVAGLVSGAGLLIWSARRPLGGLRPELRCPRPGCARAD